MQSEHSVKSINPKFYIQNRSNWCWAAAAKIVGLHYKILKPRYQFTIECSSGLTTKFRRLGFVSVDEMKNGVPTADREGLRFPGAIEVDDQIYVDAWQRAIVMNANTVKPGNGGNHPGDDTSKISALKYAITGSAQAFDIQVISRGHVNNPSSLLDQYQDEIETAFAGDRWMIGNYISSMNQKPHSVALIAEENKRIRLFDPWDGFSDIYTLDQIFRTGFLTSLGQGLIKWIQYVR